jgi:hypothetical protein
MLSESSAIRPSLGPAFNLLWIDRRNRWEPSVSARRSPADKIKAFFVYPNDLAIIPAAIVAGDYLVAGSERSGHGPRTRTPLRTN